MLIENFLADGLEKMRLAKSDAAVDEQRIVSRARRFADGNGGGVRQPVAGTGDEVIENVIRAQRQRLVVLVEYTAAREVGAMKADGDKPAGHLLRRGRE